MRCLPPHLILFLGFFLVLTGAVLPFLMVLKFLPASFGLSFLSFSASLTGLLLGLIGAVTYLQLQPRD